MPPAALPLTAPLFDPRTIIVMASVMSLLVAAVMFSLRRIYPPTIHGLLHWSIAPVLCFISTVLFAARGLIPDLVSSAGSNMILLAGATMFYFGSQRFHGITPSYKFWGTVLAAAAPAFVWFLAVDARYDVRVVLFTAVMMWILITHARLLLTVGNTNVFTRPTGYLLIFQCGFLVLRTADALQGNGVAGLLDPSGAQITYLMAYTFTFLLLALGLILMAAERMRIDFEHMATHDSLTNALTRRHMDEVCQMEMERSRRTGRSTAMLMMDLDHFKAVNDTYGHQAGDQVLANFVIKVNALLRPSDRLGRFGGEEFMALLPETSLEEAMMVAERIRAVCAIGAQGVQGPTCSVSVGVASTLDDRDTVDALLARADAAVYRAKANGRNRVEAA